MPPVEPRFAGVMAIPGRVKRAIAFSQRTDVYFAFGRTTPWGDKLTDDANFGTTIDENNPPPSDPLFPALEEPIFYRKAIMQMVVPDVAGTLNIYRTPWRLIDPAEAITLGSPYVYLYAEVDDTMPMDGFRQSWCYSGLVRDPADLLLLPGRVTLLPAHVQTPGDTEWSFFHDVVERDPLEVVDSELILTF